MKTMVLACNKAEAERYQSRNCLVGATVVGTVKDLKADTDKLILVGSYRLHKKWAAIEARMWDLINCGFLVVEIEEWPE